MQNKINYQTEEYSENVLEKYSDFKLIPVRSDSREYRTYRFEKQYLESEERYLGDGLYPLEFEYFQLIERVIANDGFNLDSFVSFSFMMSQDTK